MGVCRYVTAVGAGAPVSDLHPLRGRLKQADEEETSWKWRWTLCIASETIPAQGISFLTQKPEEEAVNLRKWAEVKITWCDWAAAERSQLTCWKRFSDQIETDD